MKLGRHQLSVDTLGLEKEYYPSDPHVTISVGCDNTWILAMIKKNLDEEVRCALDEGRYDDVKELVDIIVNLEKSIEVLDEFAENSDSEEISEEEFDELTLDDVDFEITLEEV